MSDHYEAIVIGSGPGGYVCAIRLAQHGLKTAIVERESLGGVCLNWGCIPSKAVIHAGNTFQKIRHANVMGIKVANADSASVDVGELRDWKNGIVHKLTSGIGTLLKKNGASILKGHAKFTGPNSLSIEAADGSTSEVTSDRFIIATGSRPAELPGLPLSDPRIWTAKTALDLEVLPENLAIIGGGIIGLELGTAYAKLGCKVSVIELMPQVLTGVDKELARPVLKQLKALGVDIYTESKSKAYESKDGGDVLIVETPNGDVEVPADRVLVSVGFKPNTHSLDIEKSGVEVTERGYIPKDEQGRTNVPHIFAIGDVTGPPFLAHRASKEGIVVADVISGDNAVLDYQALPAAIFTDPEIATVGLTEKEAKDKGYKVVVGRFPYGALGRALASEASEGLFKIVAEEGSGLVLGVGIVGYEASNLIAEAAATIEMAGTIEDLASTVHAHPTFPEGLMEAAEDALGHAIHKISRKRK